MAVTLDPVLPPMTTHAHQTTLQGNDPANQEATHVNPNWLHVDEASKCARISYHPESLCLHAGPLPCNIETLHLDLGGRTNDLQPLHPSDMPFSRLPTHQCPLLSNVRPKSLVMRNMSTRMLNLKIPSIPLSLFDDVDTLAITSSSFEKYQPGSWRLQIPPMKRLKKVVWVSDPSVRPKVEQKTHREWYKLNLWILAEMILVLPDVEFQVVNAGSTILKDPNYRYMSVTKRQKDAEQLVRLQVQQKSVGCQSYRSTCVRFVELREFRNNEEWAKWFSQDEMGRWDAISSELPV